MEYVMGIDVGTGSTKGVLMNRHGEIAATATRAYEVKTPQPMWAEQEGQVWLEAVLEVAERLVKAAPDVAEVSAICVSSLYGGAGIPVDARMQPLAPCLIWMDRRAEQESQWVREQVDLVQLEAITGNGVDSYYGFTKLLWIKRHWPEVWANARWFLPPNSFINYALCGELAVDHSSAGNIGGVYDLAQRRWSPESCAMLGLDYDKLPPRLVESHEVVGGLLPEMAQRLGLQAGTPVVAGGVDAAVATLAAGVTEPGDHVAMIGTSMCWGFINRHVDASQRLVSFPHVWDGMRETYSFGGAITAGASVSWFVEQFCSSDREAAGREDTSVWQQLEDKAQALIPGANGLLFLPYLMGERSPVWDARASGAVLGMSLFHTRYHLYRAVLEGVSLALRDNIEAAHSGARVLNRRLIVVGGAAASPLWMQIIADVTGFPVVTIEQEVEAPLGDAMLAARAIGWLTTINEARCWFTLAEEITPRPKAQAYYERLFPLFSGLYRNNRDTMHQLAALRDADIEVE
ncbi:TPA: FGGY-family carbohydrate kinase [Citrobacter freundii]